MYSRDASIWGCKKEEKVEEQKWIEEFEEWWNEGFKFLSPGYKDVMQGCWLESRKRLKDVK